MLQIRAAQIIAFDEERRLRTLDQVRRHLRTHFAENVLQLDEDQLTAEIRQCVQRAATYGIISDRDIVRFAGLCAIFSWDFEMVPENAWMREVLEDAALTEPGRRLEIVFERAMHRLEVESHNAAMIMQFESGG